MPSVVESDPPAIDSLAEVDRHDQGFILKRYRPNIGAVVSGIDLNKPIGQAAKKALYQALLDHGVLFFRDQEVEPDRYLEFVRIFGNTGPGNPYFPSLPGYPQIEVLESNA